MITKDIKRQVYLKQKFTVLLNNEKSNKLNLSNFSYSMLKKSPAGRIMTFFLLPEKTNFEITDFIRISKKNRSDTKDVYDKEMYSYNFTGICISAKMDFYEVNSNFLIRNVFDHCAYETRYPLFAPIIDAITILEDRFKNIRLRKKKYFYLRKKPLPESTVPFSFIHMMESIDEMEARVLKNKKK